MYNNRTFRDYTATFLTQKPTVSDHESAYERRFRRPELHAH